jgi:putative membrane protein
MKNFKTNVLKAILLMVTIIGASSCMDNKVDDTKTIAEDKNELKIESNTKEKEQDAQFLVNAAEINREEITLGQLAQEKGNTIHVTDLGKMMVDNHTTALAALTDLARTKNISLPTAQTQNELDAYKKLNKKSGNDFGKEYSGMMVNGHKDAIALFEKAAAESTDPAIKAWATATIPTLKMHLEQALTCQMKCEAM